ncbi:MAG: hypothetical protein M1828_004702 [Chrysothrix sp. TS-e1954]|nr:MAG: hypothetical protein M1828_004702 [Chrysothrix sp. TS-e1954]
MSRLGATLWRNFQVYQVFGANTNVGKTIFSTLLCRAAKERSNTDGVWYLKPVSTGPFDDADKCQQQELLDMNQNITDETILSRLSNQIKENASNGPGFMLVETAGGPHSPAPSGTSQADLFRALRLPLIFVADWRLGGISTSLSSFEALRSRGYDIDGVAVFRDAKYQNHEYFQQYFAKQRVPFTTVSLPPSLSESHDHSSMANFYLAAESDASANDASLSISAFAEALAERHEARVNRLESMASEAHQRIWWPFTQHQGLDSTDINVIDSAYGDAFQTLTRRSSSETELAHGPSEQSLLQASLDGSASWWTQGLGHANTGLTAAAAYAAGRYGHVMFAGSIHEPALSLAETLIGTLRNPRAQKVFYTDNGSAGMEVAVKMGLKAACVRYGWNVEDHDVEIIGLRNSYHGDTMGAMDMSEPSVYNQKVPWYRGRGFWFDAPTVTMRKGTWIVEKPLSLEGQLGVNNELASIQQVFDRSRDLTDDAAAYEKYIRTTLETLTQDEKRRFGALVMEPVVLGAGGMKLVDPLFQRILANVVRSSASVFSPASPPPPADPDGTSWTGLPIVHDEIFTGLYRLGHPTSSSLIHVRPDISAHAKLLTGGLLPLCATVASDSIYEAFLSDSKTDALLHGHSYTAHPIGCSVANTSLQMLAELDEECAWDNYKSDWARGKRLFSEIASGIKDAASSAFPSASSETASLGPTPPIWSVWSTAFVSALSHATTRVDGVWAMGSVLSISLKDEQGGGYTSNAAKALQQQLLMDKTSSGWNIHSRVLGNVLYLMTSQTSKEEDVRAWEQRVREALGA